VGDVKAILPVALKAYIAYSICLDIAIISTAIWYFVL